jgi:hypothetical protein
MRSGVARGVLVSLVLFSLYMNDIPTPSHYVELAQYANDRAIIATSRIPSLLLGYLEAYIGRLELWLRDWRIVIIVSKSTPVLFAKTARRVLQPRLVLSWSANRLGRNSSLCWGELSYAASLVSTSEANEKEGSSKFGRAWPPP